jgi:hypothetical protein
MLTDSFVVTLYIVCAGEGAIAVIYTINKV